MSGPSIATPVQVRPADRVRWVGLGAACVVAAVALAWLVTPDSAVDVVVDGVEHSEGELGTFVDRVASSLFWMTLFLVGAMSFAASRNRKGMHYAFPGRVAMILCGCLLLLLVGVLAL